MQFDTDFNLTFRVQKNLLLEFNVKMLAMFATLQKIPNNPQTNPQNTGKFNFEETEISLQSFSEQIPKQLLVSMLHSFGIHIRSYGSLPAICSVNIYIQYPAEVESRCSASGEEVDSLKRLKFSLLVQHGVISNE